MLINGTDIRRIAPQDYHRHITALFQSFSKLNATVRENVGIGNLQSGFRDHAIQQAAERAGASRLVNSLPCGIDTNLDCMGSGLGNIGDVPFFGADSLSGRQGLSGGEVSESRSPFDGSLNRVYPFSGSEWQSHEHL